MHACARTNMMCDINVVIKLMYAHYSITSTIESGGLQGINLIKQCICTACIYRFHGCFTVPYLAYKNYVMYTCMHVCSGVDSFLTLAQ